MAQAPKAVLSKLIQVQSALSALQEADKGGKGPLLVVVQFMKMKEINEISHQFGDVAVDQIDTLFQSNFQEKQYRLGASSAGIIVLTNNSRNYVNQVKKTVNDALTNQFKQMQSSMPAHIIKSPIGQLICNVNNYSLNFYNYKQAVEKYKDKQDVKKCTCDCLHNWDNTNEGFKACTFAGFKGYEQFATKYQCLSMDIDHLSKVISKYKTETEGRKVAAQKILDVGNSIAEYVKTKLRKDIAWGYHNSGDEFSMVINECAYEDSITLAYQLIDYVKKETGMSITVGRSYAMFYADRALDLAKKNGHRGVVVTMDLKTNDVVYKAGPGKGNDNKYTMQKIVDGQKHGL